MIVAEHLPLVGKKAVVTGSTTGIGRAIALELAEQGADVAIHGRAESDNSISVIQEIRKRRRHAWAFFQDFSDAFEHDKFIDAIWKELNGVDIWINNAGADVLTGSAAEWSLQQKLSHLFKVDVESTLFLSRSIGQRMKSNSESAGSHCILNIGWDQAYQGMAGESGELFATTKGAIMSMTKSLAQSLAPYVRVNCLAAGWIQTHWGEHTSPYWDERAKNESLMARWGRPEDIAQSAAFFSSPKANFISGQIINVNGGFKFAGEQGSA